MEELAVDINILSVNSTGEGNCDHLGNIAHLQLATLNTLTRSLSSSLDDKTNKYHNIKQLFQLNSKLILIQ